MTQEQFNTIVKIIQNGAPALAEELVSALQATIITVQKQADELSNLKTKKSELDVSPGEPSN